MSEVVVTGATGAVGGGVAAELAARGVRQRLLVRDDASRAPALEGAEPVVGSYDDEDRLAAAFDGADVLLLVSGEEHPDRLDDHRTVARVAGRLGVRRVVYTSFLGAAPDATFTLARDHHHTEVALREAGVTLTALRDAFYQDLLREFFDADGVLRAPARDGRFAPVARRDVVDVAVAAIVDERWAGATLDVTGPQLLTLDAVATQVAAAEDEPRSYVAETPEQAYASRRAAHPDVEDFRLEAWVSTWLAVADGSMAIRSDAVERVTGRPATSLARTLRTG